MDIDVTTLDPEQPLTRDEIEALERAKGMRCRGRLPDTVTREHVARVTRALPPHMQSLELVQPGDDARTVVTELLTSGFEPEARALDAALRTPCGYDFAGVVMAYPFDGEERAYECPKCGATGTIRSPVYTVRED